MTPTVEEIDDALWRLENARAQLSRAAEGARSLIDGLSAALHVRSVQLAARLLPRADDAILDGLSRALGSEELSSAAFRARLAARARELGQPPRAVSAEQLAAAEEGRRRVEAAAASLRAELLRVERDPDVTAARDARESAKDRAEKKGALRGVLSAFGAKAGPKVAKNLGGRPIEDVLQVLDEKRAELAALEDDARAAAAEVALLRRDHVRAAEAATALRALPGEALTATRAAVAAVVAAAPAPVLRGLCAVVDAREADRILLQRAKHRYAVAAASALVEPPFVELTELCADGQRWRTGVVEGGLMPPERDYVEARVTAMVTCVDAALARFEKVRARLDSFVLAEPPPASRTAGGEGEPLWWDLMFAGDDDGEFVDEVRAAHAAARAPVPAPFPSAAPDDGGDETFDTGKWIEQFYGKPLALDDFMETAPDGAPTDVEPPRTLTDVRQERRVGPYLLLERLGAGGMAEVHLAQEATTKKRVVVKLIQQAHAGDPAYRAMFEREGRIGLELVHENIVRTLELVETGGERMLILEYVEGLSAQRLCTWLRKGGRRLPVDAAALLARDAGAGLAYAHGRPAADAAGVVHRDVSPDNLLAGVDGVVKLADFGIARATDDATLTRTGELKGKLPFMAPELFEGEPASAASDVFALGVSLYFFLTHKRPFAAPTEGGTIHAIMSVTPAPPGALVDGVPPALDLLVVEMLAKDKAERPTAAAVRDALEPFTGGARDALARLVREAMKR